MTGRFENFDDDAPRIRASDIKWEIRREGRAWTGGEASGRYDLTPEKLEMIDGKLLWEEEDRLLLLGLLLENVGADQAVRLGDARVWREAVARLGEPPTSNDVRERHP